LKAWWVEEEAMATDIVAFLDDLPKGSDPDEDTTATTLITLGKATDGVQEKLGFANPAADTQEKPDESLSKPKESLPKPEESLPKPDESLLDLGVKAYKKSRKKSGKKSRKTPGNDQARSNSLTETSHTQKEDHKPTNGSLAEEKAISNPASERKKNKQASLPTEESPQEHVTCDSIEVLNEKSDMVSPVHAGTEVQDALDPTMQMEKVPRTPIYQDARLCAFILTTIESSVPLEIKKSAIATAGSGLFVTSTIDAGCEIFRGCPWVDSRNPNNKTCCEWCFSDTVGLIRQGAESRFCKSTEAARSVVPCTGCNKALYCSETCKAQAWEIVHQYECQILAEQPNMIAMQHMLQRILILDREGLFPSAFWKTILSLESHVEEYSAAGCLEDLKGLVTRVADRVSNGKHDQGVLLQVLCAVGLFPTRGKPAHGVPN